MNVSAHRYMLKLNINEIHLYSIIFPHVFDPDDFFSKLCLLPTVLMNADVFESQPRLDVKV